MYLSNQSLIVILLVGIIAGWLAGQIVAGGGSASLAILSSALLVLSLAIGCFRAWASISVRASWRSSSNAAVGAIVLLLILRLLSGGWRRNYWEWRRPWGSRW